MKIENRNLKNLNRSQVSIEYLMIVGFVSFAVLSILLIAYYYSNAAANSIKDNQLEVFADKIINSAEAVFYSGEPSMATISVYVPKNIKSIESDDDEIIITSSSSSGIQIRSFSSNVKITFDLDDSRFITEGTKRLKLTATSEDVQITLAN